MAGPWRSVGGIFGALVVLAVMALLAQSLRSKLYGSAAEESNWEAQQLVQRAQDEINLKARELEARVASAASLNPVRALVAHGVDRATIIDAFATEEWWRTFREEFPVALLSSAGGN